MLAAGGVSAPVSTLAEGETSHSWPWFLPDGQRFLYLSLSSTSDTTGLYVQGLGSIERTFLMPAQGRGAIVPAQAGEAGVLLFMRETTVLAQRLDLTSLRLEGEPVAVAEDVRTGGENGRNTFSVSGTGVMAYRAGESANEQFTWYTRDGKPAGTALKSGAYFTIELSPDDKRAAVVAPGARGADLWLLDLASGVFSRLTTGAGTERDPKWSPDSRRIVFTGQGKGQGTEIHETVVGSGTETTVLADGKANFLYDWSRDGKTLLFKVGTDVFILPLEGDKKPQLVFQTPFNTDQFRISPDGRWVTYRSSESGEAEVYVAAFPTFTQRRQISTGGAVMPRWRRDGRELFYVTLDSRFVGVDVKAGATLETGPPSVLFQTNMPLSRLSYYYAVTSDGQRFLVREPASAAAVEPLHIILNWPAALGQ